MCQGEDEELGRGKGKGFLAVELEGTPPCCLEHCHWGLNFRPLSVLMCKRRVLVPTSRGPWM